MSIINKSTQNLFTASATRNSAPLNPDTKINLESNNFKDDLVLNKREVKMSNNPVRVTCRVVFLKLGQIDTKNERYDAEAYIEAYWEDDTIFKVLSDPNMAKSVQNHAAMEAIIKQPASPNTNNLVNFKNILNNINILEYDSTLFWTPSLFIENAIGDLKEEIRHKLEIVEKSIPENSSTLNTNNNFNNLTVKVCEMRKVRGVFYERLELYDFPMDIQEISITLTSKLSIEQVELHENRRDACSINTEDFLDQQEWDLSDHVDSTNKVLYDPWQKYNRSGFTVTSFISRKPGYYLYNAYMLIFLITVLGFVPFAFDPAAPQFRCQVTGLLLLTSVNFRWIVTQRLPSVPYLTSLDKYGIGSLLFLVIFCCWHSIIGSSVITSDSNNKKSIDYYALYALSALYVIFNIFYVCWFIYMSHSISKSLNEGKQKYQNMLDERAKEFAARDKEIADKDIEYDMMEKDKDVEEINEKANSYQNNVKTVRPAQKIKSNQSSQQLNKNQQNNDASFLMQNTA